ncbi:MAG: tetratricopeptide repeat protein [Verrucomicrobiales bacterium]|nr:tetratricopeptide repeat protein [Verrucomicrobiales bacterium]MCP5526572.1 tetratricopeptide repeat protein [Verrucomicrobiales bacterium]
MKRARHPAKSKRAAPAAESVPAPVTPGEATRTPATRRTWWFRVAAALGIPLLFLGGLELALRLAGYGHPSSFLVAEEIEGRPMLVENDAFGLRFFPAALARSPSAVRMDAIKPPGACRIFLLGESAALGDPRPAYGMGRYLEMLLRERFRGREFEVVCVAMTAINSHAILPIARECARLQGDVWVVYMGNNEMAGPFGANTVMGPQAPPLALVRASLALGSTRIGQWFGALREWLRPTSAPAGWEGLKMFNEARLPPHDPRREVVHRNFAANLDDILRVGTGAGAKIVLCTVAGNLKDCAPFASLPGRDLGEPAGGDWEAAIRRGQERLAADDPAGALIALERAAAASPDDAETAFRYGACLLAMGREAGAAAAFARARDLDALPFRTDSVLNALITAAAGRYAGRGVRLLDAPALLGGACASGIPGGEVFLEHVHLNFDGNYRMAVGIAEQVRVLLGDELPEDATGEWASQTRCEALLGLTDWNRRAVYREVLGRISEAPFTNQLDHADQVARLTAQAMAAEAGTHPSGFMDALAGYEEVLEQRPDDFRVREGFAEFLEANDSLGEATDQWQRIQVLLPRHPAGWFHAGRLLARQERAEEAEKCLRQALALRPDLAQAHTELARLLLQEQRPDEALAHFDSARKLRANDARLRVEMADALAAHGRRNDALTALREAIAIQPDYWEARYLLGVELAVDEDVAGAAAEFAEVVRLRPQFARGHLNLGVAQVRLGKVREAVEQFRLTLQIEPDNPRAAEYLRTLQAGAPGPSPSAGR